MSGFEINRFIGLSERESKYLICSICLNVFNNAIRSDCEHNFCKQCVENWIKTNKKDCPECRKGFAKRKRNLRTSSDNNSLIVSDYVFRTNLLVNNMINELKIKCDNEGNGCQEVIQLDLLSSHLKECKHRICKTCGLPVVGNDKHIPQICIELLKNERNEWKNKFNENNEKLIESKKMFNKRNEEFNQLKQKYLKLYNAFNESKKKLNEINEKFNELKEKNLKLEEKVKQLESLPSIPTTSSLSLSDSIPELSLEPIDMCLGTIKFSFEKLSLNSSGVCLSRVRCGPNLFDINISFIEIQELFYGLKPMNVIILKPLSNACLLMKEKLFGNNSPNAYKFDVNSNDPKHWYIIIVLKGNIDVYVSQLINRSKDMPIKVKELSKEEVNHFIERVEK